MGLRVSEDLQGRADSVRQVDNLKILYLPTRSVSLWGKGSEKGQWPFCLGESCSPSSCIDTRPFPFSLYATGAFQAATEMLELRGSESE